MFTPMVEVVLFLSATFVLGLTLGWVLWKFGGSKEIAAAQTEVQFWQQRLDQARNERDRDQDKIEALETERDKLKQRIRTSAAAAS